MRRAFLLATYLLCVAASADDWPAPRVQGAISPDGRWSVRVVPSPPGMKAPSRAFIYEFDGKCFVERQAFTLVNDVAPVDVLITDDGRLFTFDNWHAMGFGPVVVAYDGGGKMKASFTLKHLYSARDAARLELEHRSVSSIWWRCRDVKPEIYGEWVVVHDALGGVFRFAADGTFEYEKPGRCAPGG